MSEKGVMKRIAAMKERKSGSKDEVSDSPADFFAQIIFLQVRQLCCNYK